MLQRILKYENGIHKGFADFAVTEEPFKSSPSRTEREMGQGTHCGV